MNFKRLVKPYYKNAIIALGELVAIPSIYDETTKSDEKPYGENIDRALKLIGELGTLYGFDVDYCDGRGTELSLGDKGPLISIFAHLDVVPVSEGWKTSPFEMFFDDTNDMMYGRGVADDKGPGIAAFYAVKALKDNGMLDGVRIKLFFGGDEERGSSCLHYYFHELKKEAPKYGFTPDSAFPLIYGEKGITTFKLHKEISLYPIKKIVCGSAPNIVPDKCYFYLENDKKITAKLKQNNVKYSINNDLIEVISEGKAAHGSVPQLGSNAFINGVKILNDIIDVDFLKLVYETLNDYNGKGFDGFITSPHLKETTYNLGLVEYEDDKLTFTINFRYPENCDAKQYINKLAKKLSMNEEYKKIGSHLLFDPESEFIKTLMTAYKKEMHIIGRCNPLTTGGGTYAKEAYNTVAFGSEFPGCNYHMHENDECYPISHFKKAMAIYARAIYMLKNLG